jgi:hypothetical protein
MSRSIAQLGIAFGGRARRWAAQQREQLALIARFGPLTVRAWAGVLRVIVMERLWTVPPRSRSEVVNARTHS